jgi:DNA gyrase subunit A
MVMPQRRERVVPRLIEEEMRESFLDYSMSVIVQRALPDVRDGLKPVHRRILYAMRDLGLSPARPYKKSAAVVGEVLGKYHPHGDAAVYDSLVRMVQDFAMRYPLVDGQGNFGSIDGDSAAAYRYTEAKLAPIAMELLRDIESETVPFTDTFDSQRQEPVVLPAIVPNLLVNGSAGIAVGMATNIPPHNLREVARAIRHVVQHPDCKVDDLFRFVPGPDFPTGGYILGVEGIRDAYRKGRGRMVMRARIQREEKRGGKEQLVVTELPYGISKSRVIEQIADLARTKKIDDLADLRDESDRDGMRIVIELKRGARIKNILATLYKQTHLQATFGAIMLALDKGQPREMDLKTIIERYRDHRLEVIQNRARYELTKAKEERHIIDGLIIALDNIDAVIRIIRKAADREEASGKLRAKFELSERQATAILDMRLARLTTLETKELRDRLRQLKKRITELEALLASQQLQLELLLAELDELVERFGDARRTEIVKQPEDVDVEEYVAQEDVVVMLTHRGYIKRVPMQLYRRRVGRGSAAGGMEKYEDDFLEHVFVAGTQDALLFFTRRGQVHAMPVFDVPEAGAGSRGRSVAQILGIDPKVGIAALLPVADFSVARQVVFLTASGIVKRTPLEQFANARASGIAAIGLKDDDRLVDVQLSDGVNDMVLVTRAGRAIRFPESDVPVVGRTAQGVKGVQVKGKDAVVGMVVVRRDAALCTVSEQGFAKRTPVGDFAVQKRGGLGLKAMDISKKTGDLVAAKEVLEGDELMVLSANGAAVRLPASRIALQGRSTMGRQVIELKRGDRVVEVTRSAGGSGRDREAGEVEQEELELVE